MLVKKNFLLFLKKSLKIEFYEHLYQITDTKLIKNKKYYDKHHTQMF